MTPGWLTRFSDLSNLINKHLKMAKVKVGLILATVVANFTAHTLFTPTCDDYRSVP